MCTPTKGKARSPWRTPQSASPRGPPAAKPPVPHYKVIPGTNFLVDGFTWKDAARFQSYFLSHFHSDHYVGITKGFHHGKIYCSSVTAKLVRSKLGVRDEMLVGLGLNQWHDVDGHGVCCLEANHCPGAVIFLFRVNNLHYLHTGDFRYSPKMKEYPALQNVDIEGLFLDTTFLNPKYDFPPQEVALQAAAEIALKEDGARTLILIGTYQIGKEKVLLSVAKALGKKVFVTAEKWKLLQHLDIDLSYFVHDPLLTNIHVVPLNWLNFESMSNVLNKFAQKYSRVIGISPTGWNNSPKPHEQYVVRKQGFVTIYGLPYSEHCSYSELREFVSWVNPRRIIPTVNCANNAAVQRMLKHFEEKPLKKPDYGTLFPLIKRMQQHANQQLVKEEVRAELKEVEAEEPPPLRLVVADSQLLLLDGEPEDSYIGRRTLSDDLIVLSDDAAPDPIPAAAARSASADTYLSVQASFKETKLADQEIIDLDALVNDNTFIDQQRQMEVLFAAKVSAAVIPQSPPSSQGRPRSKSEGGSPSEKKQKKQHAPNEKDGDAASKSRKRAKTLTPDKNQPTLFSFLTRSKSANLTE